MKGTASKSENKITAIMAIFIMILVFIAFKNGSFQPKEGTVNPTTQVTVDKSVVPGSCLVLQEEYCRMVKLVTINGYLIAAFKLPTDVPIFSPFSGRMRLLKYPGYPPQYGMTVSKGNDWVNYDNNLRIAYTGVVNGVMKNIYLVSKGDILARTREANLDSSVPGEHNLLMYFTNIFSKNGSETPDNAKTKAVFGIS